MVPAGLDKACANFQNEHVNPEKLALLSDGELHILADRMGLNLPEGLERLFVLEEILDALDEDSQERRLGQDGPGHVEEKKYSGAYPSFAIPAESSIPQRYNETMIRALPRDPSWVFAYWDISENKRAVLCPEDGDPGLFLRVSELSGAKDHQKRDYFDIPVSRDDCQWYINTPHPGARYRIDLCMHASAKAKVLAKSDEIRLPLQYMDANPDSLPQATRRLLLLSGCSELNIAAPRPSNPSRILPDGE
ncbi:MAG: DUF4912 domain-containing protein [Rectinema sp.]